MGDEPIRFGSACAAYGREAALLAPVWKLVLPQLSAESSLLVPRGAVGPHCLRGGASDSLPSSQKRGLPGKWTGFQAIAGLGRVPVAATVPASGNKGRG